ncbi:MAG: hypothetical protein KatS3mg105_2591 [Gemmatales bacterium]|nr:MAG: hypothetical protein KatS3mg105_2591 [Gemmatales bacterium]
MHEQGSIPISDAGDKRWRYRLIAATLIVLSAGLHLAYLAAHFAFDLAPDEAHYWDWSRRLDWSYYSKGPLVAYLIRAGIEVAGPISRQLTQTDMWAVRLPAVLCGSLLLLSLYVLTVQVTKREKLALGVVAIALTLPLVAAGSSLMTIDAPYTCIWGWALVLGYQAAIRRSPWAWPALGLLLGLGMLAKYTMLLWLPSFGLFLLTSRRHRPLLSSFAFWAMVFIAFVCCLPILIWNAQHDWVTFRHVGGQAGVTENGGIRWLGPLNYLGTQFAVLLGFWFVVWVAAMLAYRPGWDQDEGRQYLWWLSMTTFAVFCLFSFKNGGGQANWPVTAYLAGLVLTANWIADRWQRRVIRTSVFAAAATGLLLIFCMHFTVALQPLLARISGKPSAKHPFPLRRFDPTCRIRGWRFLANEVDRVRQQLREEGIEPVLVASGWNLPGEIGFYCQGQPQVYSFGLVFGDRWSQYDLWRPNPLFDPEYFAGKTFVLIGPSHPCLGEAFDHVEPSRIVTYQENGHPIAQWGITVCRGYRGFSRFHPQVEKF